MKHKTQHKNPDCSNCAVRASSIFCELEQRFLDTTPHKKKCNVYRKGDTIFYEDNHPLGIYCIYNGKAKLSKTNEYGKEQIIRLAKEGDVLGYRSLISGESYNATATALEDCSICFIPQDMFLEFLKDSKNLFLQVTQLLADDLKTAENHVAALAQKSVRERVADTILMLSTFYGLEEDSQTIKAILSREDLANLVGTATESVIRMLSEFKNEKLIALPSRKIKILNINKIKEIAHQYD
ncbi:MAG: Crp/Fnr family transcriptional regulator [Thermonemataceae bacterium]